MPSSRPPYSPEFRRQAVELVRSGGASSPQIADELRVPPQSLRNWVKQAALDSSERRDGLTSDERVELRRLRRDNRQLQQEREILKAAAAFWTRPAVQSAQSSRMMIRASGIARYGARTRCAVPGAEHTPRVTLGASSR